MLLSYVQILEHDRLMDARAVDRDYFRAKQTALAFNEPEKIWAEHLEVRAALLTAETDPPPPTFWRDVAGMHRRLIDAGLIPPNTGGVN